MGFAQESGYTPLSVEQIMLAVMTEFNSQFGTTYTAESFLGTNPYKFFYSMVQRLQANEVRTSEIFAKLQQYIELTNQRILRPSVTNPGLIEAFAASDFIASVKKPIDVDAGKVYVCVDTDEEDEDYADVKLEICNIIMNSTVAGTVSQGTEVENLDVGNGQHFDFKFNLPNRLEVALRLTVTLSDNNQSVIDDPETVKQRLLDNIQLKYSLGKNFEPQRYFTTADAPWASQVVLEYTLDVTDGEIDETPDWETAVFESEYDELFDVKLELIELIED